MAVSELLKDFKVFKKFDFPDAETFEIMTTVLKADRGKGVEGVNSYDKHRIVQRYALVNSEGEEYIVGKGTTKGLLRQSEAAEVCTSLFNFQFNN